MKIITKYAKENRKKLTYAEKVMKKLLLKFKIKFRTQRQFGFYIVDFLIPEKRIAIEIDGEYHNERKEYDNKRTNYLEKIWEIKVIRFSNSYILNERNHENIKEIINSYKSIPIIDWKKTYGFAKY